MRIEKIKQRRQKEIQKEEEWRQTNDENDKLIERLSRLKPVEPVLDPDIEFLRKEEEIERQKDEFFKEKESRVRPKLPTTKSVEPVQQDDNFRRLFKDAKTLLLDGNLMKKTLRKKPFIRKLDIYALAMRKKLMDLKKYNNLKLNIDVLLKKLTGKRKIDEDIILEMMKNIEKASR